MKLIINFTPTGMIPTKETVPSAPISAAEIVEDVHRAREIGISMVHLHARDQSTGAPTYRSEIYGRIIEGIRAFDKELVICVSLSGRNVVEFERRAEPLQLGGDLKPDMGSLTLSSLNFSREASVNAPDMVKKLAQEMKARGILPELEAFDIGMINYAAYLHKKGQLQAPHYFNLILGNIAGAQADLRHMGLMVGDLPPDSYWALGGIGAAQLPANAIAIAAGGGVRVGLEDNYWQDKQRSRLATNATLLQRVHRLAEANERTVMPPKELREILALLPGNGHYGRISA